MSSRLTHDVIAKVLLEKDGRFDKKEIKKWQHSVEKFLLRASDKYTAVAAAEATRRMKVSLETYLFTEGAKYLSKCKSEKDQVLKPQTNVERGASQPQKEVVISTTTTRNRAPTPSLHPVPNYSSSISTSSRDTQVNHAIRIARGISSPSSQHLRSGHVLPPLPPAIPLQAQFLPRRYSAMISSSSSGGQLHHSYSLPRQYPATTSSSSSGGRPHYSYSHKRKERNWMGEKETNKYSRSSGWNRAARPAEARTSDNPRLHGPWVSKTAETPILQPWTGTSSPSGLFSQPRAITRATYPEPYYPTAPPPTTTSPPVYIAIVTRDSSQGRYPTEWLEPSSHVFKPDMWREHIEKPLLAKGRQFVQQQFPNIGLVEFKVFHLYGIAALTHASALRKRGGVPEGHGPQDMLNEFSHFDYIIVQGQDGLCCTAENFAEYAKRSKAGARFIFRVRFKRDGIVYEEDLDIPASQIHNVLVKPYLPGSISTLSKLLEPQAEGRLDVSEGAMKRSVFGGNLFRKPIGVSENVVKGKLHDLLHPATGTTVKVKCPMCPKTFNSVDECSQHMMISTDKEGHRSPTSPMQCTCSISHQDRRICSAISTTPSAFRVHFKMHIRAFNNLPTSDEIETMNCAHCSKSFKKIGEWNAHRYYSKCYKNKSVACTKPSVEVGIPGTCRAVYPDTAAGRKHHDQLCHNDGIGSLKHRCAHDDCWLKSDKLLDDLGKHWRLKHGCSQMEGTSRRPTKPCGQDFCPHHDPFWAFLFRVDTPVTINEKGAVNKIDSMSKLDEALGQRKCATCPRKHPEYVKWADVGGKKKFAPNGEALIHMCRRCWQTTERERKRAARKAKKLADREQNEEASGSESGMDADSGPEDDVLEVESSQEDEDSDSQNEEE